jgi:hypothetical protein
MNHRLPCFVLVVAVLALPAGVRADGPFFEGLAGIAQPLADDDYTDVVDTSLKLGARIGSMQRSTGTGRLGFDIGIDWSPINHTVNLPGTLSVHRLRGMLGARFAHDLGNATLLLRLAAGLEHVSARYQVTVLGTRFTSKDSDTGLAIDPSISYRVHVGGVALGASIGLPIGFHDEGSTENFDLDHTSIDLEILFVLSTSL